MRRALGKRVSQLLLFGLLAGGCYAPNRERACEVSCVANGPCPGDLVCGAGNLCRNTDGTCDPTDDDAGPPTDTGPDGPTVCIGQPLSPLKPCVPPPTSPLTITGPTTIDTGIDMRCVTFAQSGDPRDDLCVIAATDLTLNGQITIVGPRPIAFAATNTIQVEALLDAASRRGVQQLGAGANFHGCPATTVPGDGGGGAGGSFGTSGGNGGSSNGAGGGVAALPMTTGIVRGGCAGQDGENNASSARGDAGAGGGAIFLIATVEIVLDGCVINASGEAGQGGAVVSGGGGGGSGGLIMLDAPSITMPNLAKLIANGGGGGQGGASGTIGEDGSEAPDFDISGQGGNTGGAGGNGGNGAVGSMSGATAAGTSVGFGAGGGGGGMGGLIVISNPMMFPAGAFSPPPTFPLM